MENRIAVVGCGNIGSRYLQGLKKVNVPLAIEAVDINPAALALGQQRWGEVEVNESSHTIQFHGSVKELSGRYAIVIVATSASIRPAVVTELCNTIEGDYYILEKLLAQSVGGLDILSSQLAGVRGVWVNTPMRSWSLYRNIRKYLKLDEPLEFCFKGFSNLICNSVHYVDLVSGWTNSRIESVSTDELGTDWYETKRQGFYDISGALTITFSNGSRLRLESYEAERGLVGSIRGKSCEWSIREKEGLAVNNDGLEVTGACEMQSELTTSCVHEILNSGSCGLPTLVESINQHGPLLSSLQRHWDQSQAPILLPVT